MTSVVETKGISCQHSAGSHKICLKSPHEKQDVLFMHCQKFTKTPLCGNVQDNLSDNSILAYAMSDLAWPRATQPWGLLF